MSGSSESDKSYVNIDGIEANWRKRQAISAGGVRRNRPGTIRFALQGDGHDVTLIQSGNG